MKTTESLRTRFAPSPTGHLHLGSARTALFSWLYARQLGGQFILRVEDTDQERSTQAYVDSILEAMQWLGLDYDEGPFHQMQRFERYTEVIQQLLLEGKAYRCYCSKERLETLREAQIARKEKPRYDGLCRNLKTSNTSENYVVRFRNPIDGDVMFDDMIRGRITVANSELDDLIIARSDGVPTYNFTVVVDDWDMKITHVIRGDDHINNTPRQINILAALNADIPQYAHLPMILGSDGQRLSKRHGAVNVLEYREQGYLPQALLNYLVRLGWSSGDKEIFSREEMIQLFNITSVSHSPAAFNPEKLLWLNQHYLKTISPTDLIPELKQQFKLLNISLDKGPPLEKVIEVQAERCKTLAELALRSKYFYEPIQYVDSDEKKYLQADIQTPLKLFREKLVELKEWKTENIHAIIVDVAEKQNLKLGKLAQPVRVAVTGSVVSPSIDVTLYLIGKQRVLERLDAALNFIGKSSIKME